MPENTIVEGYIIRYQGGVDHTMKQALERTADILVEGSG